MTPALLEARERHFRDGVQWRFQGLRDWSTAAIFARLNELGIDTDERRFRLQAQTADGTDAMEAAWLTGIEARPPGFWEDFPFIAADELWRRLLPEKLCPELLGEEVNATFRRAPDVEGGDLESEDAQKIEIALRIIEWARAAPLEERTLRFERVSECTDIDLSNWLWELFRNKGPKHPDAAVTIAEALPELTCHDDRGSNQGDLADVLACAGRIDEARALIDANLLEHPKHFWAHTYAGDTYAWVLHEPERAVSFYTTALDVAEELDDWEVARDRLIEVLTKLGRRTDWPAIQASHPAPPPLKVIVRGRGPWGTEVSAPAPEPLAARLIPPVLRDSVLWPKGTAPSPQRKVGRNEPCPCGSTLKFKKCCGAAGQR